MSTAPVDDATRERFLTSFLMVQPSLRSYVQALVGPESDTDDLVQEISPTLWREYAHYDQTRPFIAWVIGIARNLVARYRRNHAVQRRRFSPQAEAALNVVTGGERQVVGEPVVTETSAAPRSDDRPERLIQRSAVWSYRDDGVEPEAGWLQAGFDDRHWRRGPAPLGYDRNEERAVITTHIRSDDRSVITGWFRHEFTCEDPDQIKTLIVKLQRDDGAVIYLNGREVVRDNMPDGPITAQTFATQTAGEHEERTFVWTIPRDALRTGRNCIAADVHQYALKSTDLLFSLELHAEYRATGGTTP